MSKAQQRDAAYRRVVQAARAMEDEHISVVDTSDYCLVDDRGHRRLTLREVIDIAFRQDVR